MSIFERVNQKVDSGHILNCQKCKIDISLVKSHTHVTKDGMIICTCIDCSVSVLKDIGLFTFCDSGFLKKRAHINIDDVLRQMELVNLK